MSFVIDRGSAQPRDDSIENLTRSLSGKRCREDRFGRCTEQKESQIAACELIGLARTGRRADQQVFDRWQNDLLATGRIHWR